MKRERAGATLPTLAAETRLVLLFGEDQAQVHALAGQLVAALGDPADPMARVDLGPDTLRQDPARLADEAAAVSMFGGRRVIRVDGAGETCAEAVRQLLAAPAAGNTVVMTSTDNKGELVALVEAAPLARAFICYEPSQRDMESHATEAAAGLGLRLGRGVAARLAAACDGERGVLARELEKLALYLDASPARPELVEAAHVDAVGASYAEADFASLVEAVLGGDVKAADDEIDRHTAQGTAGIPALRALLRQIWRLIELRLLVEGGGRGVEAVIEAQGKRIFWKEKPALARQLGRWTQAGLSTAAARLLEIERAIMASGSAGDLLARQAMLGLARRAA